MSEKPLLSIIDRDTVSGQIAEHFAPQVELLQQLVNYGSGLVVRAYRVSPKDMSDVIVCGVLLKQVVAMLDAFQVLVTVGIVNAAQLQLRAAFEASLYLEWMLISDKDLKGRHYYVFNLRKRLLWAQRGVKGSKQNDSFSQVTETIGLDIHKNRPTLSDEAKKQVEEIEKILAQPELKPISEQFANGKSAYWFNALGVKHLREIAITLKREAEYDIFFKGASDVVHSGTYKGHIELARELVSFTPIRHLESISSLVRFMVPCAMRAYERVLGFYRPDELKTFAAKYVAEWREPFLSIKEVTYKKGGI